MKIIFLDIDGVLNSRQGFMKRNKTGRKIDQIHQENLEVLKKIITFNLNIKVVISSTWRIDSNIDFNQLLGIPVIGKTPILQTWRGLEIKTWIEKFYDKHANPNRKEVIDNFIILDDDSDMLDLRERLYLVFNDTGLLEKDVDPIIKMLNTSSLISEFYKNFDKVKVRYTNNSRIEIYDN